MAINLPPPAWVKNVSDAAFLKNPTADGQAISCANLSQVSFKDFQAHVKEKPVSGVLSTLEDTHAAVELNYTLFDVPLPLPPAPPNSAPRITKHSFIVQTIITQDEEQHYWLLCRTLDCLQEQDLPSN